MRASWKELEEAKAAVLRSCPRFPSIVIALGSGLSALLNDMEIETEIPYGEIPHVKSLSVEGHVGKLVVGRLAGVRVACMRGRLHYYEGHSMAEVVFPFRAFSLAGAETFILTNAAGGLTAEMAPPDLMLIRDHINLMGGNPLIGGNDERLGTRFPDLTHLYDPGLRKIFHEAAEASGAPLREGVYVAIHGPSYETPAEIRMYRMLGGDAVGMSTVPEAIALHHMNRRVAAISCITNLAAGVSDEPLVHADVLEVAKRAHVRFSVLVKEALQRMTAGGRG